MRRGGLTGQAWEVTGWGPVWAWEPKGSSGLRSRRPAGWGVVGERGAQPGDLLSGRASVPAHARGLGHSWVCTPHPTLSHLLRGADRTRPPVHGPLTLSHSHRLAPTVVAALGLGHVQGRMNWPPGDNRVLALPGAHCGLWGCHGDGMPCTRGHPFPASLRGVH